MGRPKKIKTIEEMGENIELASDNDKTGGVFENALSEEMGENKSEIAPFTPIFVTGYGGKSITVAGKSVHVDFTHNGRYLCKTEDVYNALKKIGCRDA